MREELTQLMYRKAKKGELTDSALATLINNIAQLGKASATNPGEILVEQPTVAEVIAGITNLPRERRLEIMQEALADVERERVSLVDGIKKVTAEKVAA